METINIYCDESCHLENDGIPVMSLGSIWCNKDNVKEINQSIKILKLAHGLPADFEIKWTKISPAKIEFYKDLVKFFFNSKQLNFRGLLVKDMSKLNHKRFEQSHDDWYSKMYFQLLRFIIEPKNSFYVYIDIKDSKGGDRTQKLHEIICYTLKDFNQKCLRRVQQINSRESAILQLADLFSGALTSANRNDITSVAKKEIIELITSQEDVYSLQSNSPFSSRKFNLFVWSANEVKNV